MPNEELTYREWQRQVLTDIREQVIKTNGRVTKLEERQDNDDLRYAFVRGVLWVMGFILTAIIIPLAFVLISHYLD